MTQQEAQTLNRLFEDGYLIQIDNGPYVTGNVSMINQLDFEQTEDENSPYVYTDEVYENQPLSEVNISEVKVYARVDWLRKLHSNEQVVATLGLGVHKDLTSLEDWNDDLDKAY